MARARQGVSPIHVLRALWRYRRQVAAHGDAYQAELATTVRTTIDETLPGRLALRGYRLAMQVLLVGVALLVLLALVLAGTLWQLEPWAALVALLPLLGSGLLALWRQRWAAPLEWLDEFADPARSVTVDELPARLHALAAETRSVANVPARLADELDELAREAEGESG